MALKHLGKDFRAEGMMFARLLNSPYPHARVRSIDAAAALAMPGVLGILTAADVKNPPVPEPQLLNDEPSYVGTPVLLLAAESELLDQAARQLGIGQAYHSAGSYGFDGLVRIAPDGRLHIHTGVGNLGAFSHSGTSRVAAEVLKVDWERCVVERGDSRQHLPWNNGRFGSNTSFTMSRTNLFAATDALEKREAIATQRFGGASDDFNIDGLRMFRKAQPGKGMTYGQAAQRATQRGGRFDGHEFPDELNVITKLAALAGSGLIGVAKDTLPRAGEVGTIAVGFIEIELDLETQLKSGAVLADMILNHPADQPQAHGRLQTNCQ